MSAKISVKNSSRRNGLKILPENFEEAVLLFKKEEVVEDTACLLSEDSFDTDALRRLVVAWSKIKILRIDPVSHIPNEKQEIWKWIWECVKYDQQELKQITGITGFDVDCLVDILIGNRLLYPDGTVSTWALKIVQQSIRGKLSIK